MPKQAPRGETTHATLQKIDSITDRLHDLFMKAVNLHYDAHYALVATERETAGMQLKALSELFQKEMDGFREAAAELKVTDVAELYVVGGHTKDESIFKAKELLSRLHAKMKNIEARVAKMVVDLVYGV